MSGDDGIDQGSLQTAIFGAQNGTVSTIVGIDLDFLRRWLDAEQYDDQERFVLLLDRVRTSSLQSLLDGYVATLADAAQRVWPSWYGVDLSAYDSSASGLLALHTRLASLASQDQRISPVWARKAVSRVLNASPPTLTGFDNSEQIRQLGLTLHRRSVIFVLGLMDEEFTAEALRSFAQSTHWLARHGGMAIVVLLPSRMARHAALETILYGARPFVRAQQRGFATEKVDPSSEPPSRLPKGDGAVSDRAGSRWLWPLIGRPHPFSPAEQKLARALAADPELAPLFTFNQPVRTVAGTRYIVDLLWDLGRISVEIDGYGVHSSERAFARDRHRDYELVLSDYLVLRMPHDEVIADIGGAMNKIRNLVRFRRDSRWTRGSSDAV
jgi:very-short-patch-repair endonuclease